MSSSNKPKKVVHYERGTKPSSHRSHHSRDSGVGSPSASDRATVHDDDDDQQQQASSSAKGGHPSDQRYNLLAVQEALSASYERIKKLEANIKALNDALTASNKENRVLRNEKTGLLKENEDLLEVMEELNQNLKKKEREASPRSSMASVKLERRPSVSARQGSSSPRGHAPLLPLHPDERPTSHHGEKRPSIRQSQTQGPPSPRQLQPEHDTYTHHRRSSSSLYDRTAPLPLAPQPPTNHHHPHPFAPRTTPIVTYAPTTPLVTYAPTTPIVSYAPQPSNITYASSQQQYHHQPQLQQPYVVTSHTHGSVSGTSSSSSGSKEKRKEKKGEFDDGKYHLQPL